ncbi:MAG: MerR family transcriptional regulator [Halothiobacillaceae bacterium]|nr:MerR family transcriptional regulator [Halothiobacillaceae bacterium]
MNDPALHERPPASPGTPEINPPIDLTDDHAPLDECVRHEDGLFPIRAVAHLTGINPITLRAWERRYQLICPTRTPTGHRLYSPDDIQKIQRVKAMAAQGMGFSQIAALLEREAVQGIPTPHPGSTPPARQVLSEQRSQPIAWAQSPQNSNQINNLIERVKTAVLHLDAMALRAVEHQALIWLSPEVMLRSVLIEGLQQLEQRDAWPDRDLGLHWFSQYLRMRLEWWLLQNASPSDSQSPLTLVDTWEIDRPMMAKEFILIMSLTPSFKVSILPPTLSQAQRVRLSNRWQARHWIRLLSPADTAAAPPSGRLSGTTQLHWCQLLPDEHPLHLTAAGVCQGGVSHCQHYLRKKLT